MEYHVSVIIKCLKNIYLELKNCEYTFAYKLQIFFGIKVLCTVLKPATEYRGILISIDFVFRFVPVGVWIGFF